MLLNLGVGELLSVLRTASRSNQSILKEISPEYSLEGCWSWNSNTLATWCKELTHLKRPWCWERCKAGGEGDNRGWDGWTALPTQWTWVWVNSRSWWWTGRPGVLQSMGSQRVRHDWATELNWRNLDKLSHNCKIGQNTEEFCWKHQSYQCGWRITGPLGTGGGRNQGANACHLLIGKKLSGAFNRFMRQETEKWSSGHT